MNRVRIHVVEERADATAVADLVAAGYEVEAIDVAIRLANERVRRALGLTRNPIEFDGRSIRAENIAGVLQVDRHVELEISPKFLGDAHEQWRADLFAVLLHTKQGALSGSVGASPGDASGLLELVARAFVDSYWNAHRRPLRRYRRTRFRSWDVRGEIVPERIQPPHPEGFAQSKVELSKANPHNAHLAAAAEVLAGRITDAATRTRIEAVRRSIGSQPLPSKSLPPLPGRLSHWAPVSELATLIRNQVDLSVEGGKNTVPGFLLRSWEAWELLVTRALRVAAPGGTVHAHKLHDFGLADGVPVSVDPDLTIDEPFTHPVDVKYRASLKRGATRISRDAAYEALVFAKAAGSDYVPLLYPATAGSSSPVGPPGSVDTFSVLEALGVRVIGIAVEVRGIGRRGGMGSFSKNLYDGMNRLATQHESGEPLLGNSKVAT